MPTDKLSIEEIELIAAENGFPLSAVVTAQDAPGFDRFRRWLDRGYGEGMRYLRDRLEAYRHPDGVLPTVRTLVMLGLPYEPAASLRGRKAGAEMVGDTQRDTGIGEVAVYASGERDYHDVIHTKLKQVIKQFKARLPDLTARGVVDTAPLLERDFAVLAGLGWIGKNTLLLNRKHGSYFFLAAILLDQEIVPVDNATSSTDHCGTCTACLDACPTKAFPEPRVLDARRCISYLTIEHRGPIPMDLREPIGDWLFGCDVCQQVCPWNRMAKPTDESDLKPIDSMKSIDLLELIDLDDEGFRERFRKTPMWRAKPIGLIRNALVVLGNQQASHAEDRIARFLRHDDSTLRSTAAWALGKVGGDSARARLVEALREESDESVKLEIEHALGCTMRA